MAVKQDPSATNTNKVISARFLVNHNHTATNDYALDIDVQLPSSGITAIFGHSGSGKTTLLRCIAGLEQPEQGRFTVNGDIWQDERVFLATDKRPIGYVFQELSLFPHLTAAGNLNYAVKRAPTKTNSTLYQQVLDIMGIESLLERYPAHLSGGERQRVAIARALLIQPKLLLMDEPLAALDTARKQEILPYLERLRSHFELPIFYVSHSLDEVARLADHIIMLDQGRLVAQGGVKELFSRIDLPVHLNEDAGVVIQGKVIERDTHWHLMRVGFKGGELWLRDGGDILNKAVRVRVLARDVSLTLTYQEDSSILNRLHAQVVDILADDDKAMSLVRLQVGDEYLIARVTKRSVANLNLILGNKVWAQIKSVAIVR